MPSLAWQGAGWNDHADLLACSGSGILSSAPSVSDQSALRRSTPLSVELRLAPRGARVEATLLLSPTLILGSPDLGVA